MILVFAGLIILLSALQFFLEEYMKPEIWLSVLGGYTAIYLGLLKQWMDHDKMFKELFLEFNQRFNDLNESLNAIVGKKELSSSKTKEAVVEKEKLSSDKTKEAVIQDYINLCAEEYLWYKTGRIDKEVWEA